MSVKNQQHRTESLTERGGFGFAERCVAFYSDILRKLGGTYYQECSTQDTDQGVSGLNPKPSLTRDTKVWPLT